MRLRNSLLLSVAICGLSLGGCAVGPNYHQPDIKLPDSFAAGKKDDAKDTTAKDNDKKKEPAIDAARWWESLHDEELNKLIERAIKGNLSLEMALDRLQQAREEEAVALGGVLPTASANAGFGRGTGSDLTRGRADAALRGGIDGAGYKQVTDVYGFDAAWELDLFGKYRRAIEAASYDTQALREARSDVLTTLIADVVRAYTRLRSLQMQQAILAQNIDTMKQYVDVTHARYQRGITNGLDAALADRQLESLQAQAAPLGAQAQAAGYTIAVLLGEFPESMTQELSVTGTIPTMPAKLTTSVPVELLRTRPDIREAERELAAATARIGVAEANLFPHVTLLGGAGYQQQGLNVSPSLTSFIWSVGPGIGLPILDFGALDAQVNVTDLRTHEMLSNYKLKILSAVKEVDTASSAYAAQSDRLQHLDIALKASQQALSLATKRYDRGLTDMLNVIDAQRQEFDLEQQYIVAQQTAAEQFIALYKALGSGWEQYQKIPSIRQPLPAVIAALRRTGTSDDIGQNMMPLQGQ
jgi:NodT family efflux transporter outer membrane factor (OMF) lipoprotein